MKKEKPRCANCERKIDDMNEENVTVADGKLFCTRDCYRWWISMSEVRKI